MSEQCFSGSLAALGKLSTLLRCSQCAGPPVSPTLLNRCGHSLCVTCSGPSPWRGGDCPVCAIPGPANEGEPDRQRVARWEAVQIMQKALLEMQADPDALLKEIEHYEREREADEPKKRTTDQGAVVEDMEIPDQVKEKNQTVENEVKKMVVSGQEMEIFDQGKDRKEGNVIEQEKETVVQEEESRHNQRKAVCENPKKKKISLGKTRVTPHRQQKKVSISPKPNPNLSKKNKRGETALHVAAIKGQHAKVIALLNQGALPNTRDNAGWTPLHEAAGRGDAEVVKTLLEHGAIPNVPGPDNVTPLHDAVAAGSSNVVELLVRFGANKKAVNGQGVIARDMTSNEEIIRVLDETESDQTESQNLECSMLSLSSAAQSESPVIYFGRVQSNDIAQARKAAKDLLPCKINDKLTEDVTHVLFESGSQLMGDKVDAVFYKSLLMGKWVLSYAWFTKAVERKKFDDENDYLLKGVRWSPMEAPSKARLNHLQHLPGLFDGFHVYLKGSFSAPYPNKNELGEIVRAGGATLLSREPDPEAIPEWEKKVPYHIRRDSRLANCSHYILYQEGGDKEPLLKYDMQHIKSLPISWLFQCISGFAIVDPVK